jgi:hypothetical protein
MSLPASVCDVLANHVTLEVECIDRMHLNLYQPRLVYPGGVVVSGPPSFGPLCVVVGHDETGGVDF